jgi:hypothetical protein
VLNKETRRSDDVLQIAVNAASDGDRLAVRGTCQGGTVVEKGLVIEGIRTSALGKPTLSGAGTERVVRVARGVRVKLLRLVITRGGVVVQEAWPRYDPRIPWVRGTGIFNEGKLILRDVVVVKNGLQEACDGRTSIGCDYQGWGAVYNAGTLVLNGSSRFNANWDGIYNARRLRLNGASSISGRTTVQNHGSLVMHGTSRIGPRAAGLSSGISNAGTMIMNDASQVSGNGGSGVVNGGTLTLADSSRISGNAQGVWNTGSLILNDSSAIRDNHLPYFYCGGSGLYCWPFNKGGGVYMGGGSLTLNGHSTISGNSTAGQGGGVWMAVFDGFGPVRASLTLNDAGTITANTAGVGGGLIYYASAHSVTGASCGPDGNVYGNSPDDCVLR